MYHVMQIMNADNWCALAVAICYCRYLGPEAAFAIVNEIPCIYRDGLDEIGGDTDD